MISRKKDTHMLTYRFEKKAIFGYNSS